MFGDKLNRVLNKTGVSLEDYGDQVDESRLSDSQLKDLERLKEREDEAAAVQESLDAMVKDVANRDDGDGEIGDIRDALTEINEKREEIKDIKKQLVVAEHNSIVSEEDKMEEDVAGEVDEDELDTDLDEAETSSELEADEDDDELEASDDEEEEEDEEDEEVDPEKAANESINYRINRLARSMGIIASNESLSPFQSKEMQRMALHARLESLEASVEHNVVSMESFSINAIRTAITSVFSVGKALEYNRKRLDSLSGDYKLFTVGDWAIELFTYNNALTKDFPLHITALIKLLDTTINDLINNQSKLLSDLLDGFTTDMGEDDIKTLKGRLSDIVNGGLVSFSKNTVPTINSGYIEVVKDKQSGFVSLHAKRDRNPSWAKSGGVKSVTVSSGDKVRGSSAHVVLTLDQIKNVIDEITKFSNHIKNNIVDQVEQTHKEVVGKIKELNATVGKNNPDAAKLLKSVEALGLGVYTTVDSLLALYKNTVYRVTSLSSNVLS